MIFFNSKKKKEEREKADKLAIAKDLWLNYKIHYVRYNIHYQNPLTGSPEKLVWAHAFGRELQQFVYENENKTWADIAMDKAGRWMVQKHTGFRSKGRGIIIQTPLGVDFEEIDKDEYDRL